MLYRRPIVCRRKQHGGTRDTPEVIDARGPLFWLCHPLVRCPFKSENIMIFWDISRLNSQSGTTLASPSSPSRARSDPAIPYRTILSLTFNSLKRNLKPQFVKRDMMFWIPNVSHYISCESLWDWRVVFKEMSEPERQRKVTRPWADVALCSPPGQRGRGGEGKARQ